MPEACEKVKYAEEVVKPKKENVERYKEVFKAQYGHYMSDAP